MAMLGRCYKQKNEVIQYNKDELNNQVTDTLSLRDFCGEQTMLQQYVTQSRTAHIFIRILGVRRNSSNESSEIVLDITEITQNVQNTMLYNCGKHQQTALFSLA